MARPLRHHPKGAVLEITTRCLGSRFLLCPSPRMTLIIQGVLARALARYGVRLHHFFFASNHYHLIVSIDHVDDLAAFMGYLNGNTAREAGRLVDWQYRFWSRRYRSIEVLDEEAQVERMAYLLAHGCKEGLVAHPTDWPGATGVHALLHNTPVEGIWVNRTALYQARRQGEDVSEDDFTDHTTFELSPLPAWSHLPLAERRQRVLTLIEKAVAEAEDQNRKLDRTPLGPQALMLVDPHSAPADSKTSPAPRAHFRDVNYWIDFLERMHHFTIEYREASYRYLRGEPDVRFPRDCFPPPLTFASPRNQALFPT